MTRASRLNLGCSSRFNTGVDWLNVDFVAKLPHVKRLDLRVKLPFEDNSFQFIYISHVLDHFRITRIHSLLAEIYDSLVPGGVLRVVVPDLEANARAYIRSVSENRDHPERHKWFTIELIDQMVRTEPGGEKARFLVDAGQDAALRNWLRPMLGSEMLSILERPQVQYALWKRLRRGLYRLWKSGKFEHSGERHYWAFDEIGLRAALRRAGFTKIERVTWNSSGFDKFLEENLDVECGVEYKPNSLYMEASK